MEGLSKGEQKYLANFFNNLAVAWIATGIIAPAYTFSLPISIRVLYLISGIIGGLVCLSFSLNLSKDV